MPKRTPILHTAQYKLIANVFAKLILNDNYYESRQNRFMLKCFIDMFIEDNPKFNDRVFEQYFKKALSYYSENPEATYITNIE